MEPEFNRIAPEGVSIHAGRVPVGDRTREGFSNKDQPLESAVRLLSDMNIRSYAYACTAVNMLAGEGGDIEQAKKIIALTGRPAAPASIALVEALTALKVKRITVATVLPKDLNEVTAEFWRGCGFEWLGVGGLDLGGSRKPIEPFSSVPISSQGFQTPEAVYNMARSVYHPKAEAVVISGANLRSIETAAM